jgi:glycolate oxidase
MRRPIPAGFLSRLEAVVGASQVITDPDSLTPVASDETPNLAPALPDAWVRPANTAEVAAIMSACHEAGVYVTPRGAGTGQSGGCVAIHGGIVLGLDRLNTLSVIDSENLVARGGPGLVLGRFQEMVEAEGLFYPPDPASLEWCTLGGNVAENAGGPRALKYGVTRDYVLGLEVVLPDGEVIQTGKSTVKGVAGYDLTALMCGSEGTLGVITGMTLKLIPRPQAVQTALCVFESAEAAARAVAAILSAGVLPRTLEYMDRSSIMAVAAHGAPYSFSDDAGAALILETDGGDDDLALFDIERALDAMPDAGRIDTFLATDERQRRSIWQSRRLLSEATRKIRGRKMSEDIVVPRSRIPDMVAAIGVLGERHGLGTCAFGHAGDGNLHVQILFSDDGEVPAVQRLVGELFALTIEMGGTITGEHGVGVAKRDYLGLEQGPRVLDLQHQIKGVFDPRGILNPGKIFPPKKA